MLPTHCETNSMAVTTVFLVWPATLTVAYAYAIG